MRGYELVTSPASDDVPVGASKLGGRPDLPPGEPWPSRDGRPLSFVVQVDLATADTGGVLPPDGLLSFFYDAVEQPWGFEEGDDAGTVVRWTPPGTALERREFPDDLDELEARFDEMRVELTPATPAEDDDDVEEDDEVDDDEDEPLVHRLLGAPDEIQEELDDAGTLLFQVDSDDGAAMMWGDGGRLYVFLPPDALARRDWTAAHTVLQCH